MNEARKRRYRLGLDLGSNSLGWFMVWLDGESRPQALGPGGVRIRTFEALKRRKV